MTFPNSLIFGYVLGLLTIIATYLYNYYNQLPLYMSGDSVPQYRETARMLKNHITSNAEHGASVAVVGPQGTLLDMQLGYADAAYRLPWREDTLTRTYTISNLVCVLSLALLADLGALKFTDAVADHLPDFVLPNVTVGDLLGHRARFPYVEQASFRLADWHADQPRFLADFLNSAPPHAKEEGEASFHHHSLAVLADALVRRRDARGRSLARFFTEEFARPLSLGLQVGLPRTLLYRAARQQLCSKLDVHLSLLSLDFSARTLQPVAFEERVNTQRQKAFRLFADFNYLYGMDVEQLEVPLASANTFAGARDLARLLARVFLPAEQGKGPLRTATAAWLLACPRGDCRPQYDPILERYVAYTNGGLQRERIVGLRDDVMGQFVFLDPANRLAMAYLTNHAHCRSVSRDALARDTLAAIYASIQ